MEKQGNSRFKIGDVVIYLADLTPKESTVVSLDACIGFSAPMTRYILADGTKRLDCDLYTSKQAAIRRLLAI